MNMKKTIAGVMAGAMAVSAMATMVSADQESISLTYDLKRYETVKNDTKAEVTYVINFTNGSSDYGFDVATGLDVGISDGDYLGKYDLDTGAWTGGGSAKLWDVEVSFTPLKNLKTDTVGATVTQKWVAAESGNEDWVIKNYTPTSAISGSKMHINLDPTGENYAADTLNIKGFDTVALGQTSSKYAYAFQNGSIKLTYKVPATVVTSIYGTWTTPAAVLTELGMTTTGDKTLGQVDYLGGVSAVTDGIKGKPQPVSISTFKAGASADKIFPLKSTLTAPANVTKALTEQKAGGKYYTNPVAVLNDAIANNENVVFEFKSYNGYVATAKSRLFGGDWIDVDRAYGYSTTAYDWYNPTFGQHLYTNLDNSYSLMGQTEFDMFGSYSSAWAQNLFTGAIVVNSGLTMQLSDTDKFNWGNDTLSFDWFTITDEGKVTEAKTFLTKMLLYTPVDWYWDTLTVTVGNLEEDDIVPGAGATDDSDVIDDGSDVEIVIDPVDDDVPVVTDAPVVVTEAPATEATPVAPVESPKTGNAPVALAVIPVALAAAAVVAKKRG